MSAAAFFDAARALKRELTGAADGLTRACARQGAIVNAENIHPLAGALKRSFRASLLTPKDMLDTLRKAK